MTPRLGVLGYGPIQYHTPLWQLMTKRGNVKIDVLFLSDTGHATRVDPSFGVPISWDIDLLSGYNYNFVTRAQQPTGVLGKAAQIARWIPAHDTVVVNGYISPWMQLAMAMCRARGIPYFLRASSHQVGQSAGWRRRVRPLATHLAVAGAAGGLSMGRLNDEFYYQNRARSIVRAPNSVDNKRFADSPLVSRSDLLTRWNLCDTLPLVIFSGKLIPRKRPLDLVAALRHLPNKVNVLFVGDGSLARQIRAAQPTCNVAVTGFVNQSEIPAYYHAADVLVLPSEVETWGLVVNEAMAAGTLPVVSDQVGCVPDLVRGVGEVFRCGDIRDLAGALGRALTRARDPRTCEQVRRHVDRYSLERTAEGFERAALSVTSPPGIHARSQ